MKKLHHPGIPCRITKWKNFGFKEVSGENLEAVKCNKGWGLFGDKWWWIDDFELQKLKKTKKIKIIYPKPSNLVGWGFYSPISLEIEVTKECNQRCIHCWNVSGNRVFLPIKDLKRIVRDFRKDGGQKLKLTGGEPLMHPYFFDFLAYSKNQGVKNIEVTTNGSFIDAKIAKDLSRYLNKINISLHGAKEDIHNRITRSHNYSKTRDAISYCNRERIETIINFTVMEENIHYLKGIFNIGRKTGSRIRFNLLMQKGNGRNLKNMSQELSKLRRVIDDFSLKYDVSLEKSELYSKGYNKDIDAARFYGCSALRIGVYISAEGLAFPCNLASNPLGNIYHDSIEKIWSGENTKKIKQINCQNDGDFICGGVCKANKI